MSASALRPRDCRTRMKKDQAGSGSGLGVAVAVERGASVAEEKVIFGVQNNSTFLECLPSSPQTTILWLVQHSNAAILKEVGSLGRFSVLDQGLLISQLTPEDAGTYHCQGVEQTFSQTLTRYSLRVIGHQAMDLLTSRTSKAAEGAAGLHSVISLAEMQLPYKGYSRALGASGSNLDDFCNALQQRRRRRQKDWNRKWQPQHQQESKRGRVRRQPGPP